MAKDFDGMEDSNRSEDSSIHQVSNPARRRIVHGGFAALASGAIASWNRLVGGSM